MKGSSPEARAFRFALVAILAAGAALRIAYTIAQPAFDPTFDRPMLDGAYYVAWARALAGGGGGFERVYYLGPLYAYLLVVLEGLLGAGFTAIYLVQHALIVAVAGGLAVVGRRMALEANLAEREASVAGWAAAALALVYHPAVFFASRPLSEPLGMALLVGSLFLLSDPVPARIRPLAAGSVAGLAALARPSFLLLPLVWFGWLAATRRSRAAVALAAGALVAVLPVTIRNFTVSGHLVPVSANAGIVLWLGNAPEAMGLYTPVEGFSGKLDTQQAEAIALASERSGRRLDAVEADRFWMREAARARLDDPRGTLSLTARRLLLTLDDAEHGLDYAPSLDENPWRRAFPLPFAVMLGLAASGVIGRGFRGSGGTALWLAVAACAVTPVVFYVSSRHRLPLALLLAVPAGAGLASVVSGGREALSRRIAALAGGVVLALVSWLYPSGGIVRAQQAAALANLAVARKQGGDLPGAERDARRALDLDPACASAAFNLGVVLEAQGRHDEAEGAYRDVLAHDPTHAEAAANLAGLLVRRGEAAAAVPILREVLSSRPRSDVCWTNLVVALAAAGDRAAAREAAGKAAAQGVRLEAGLVEMIGGGSE